jgi:hypothetical protein
MHEYAPLVAAQFDVAPVDAECNVFALINNTRICSLAIVTDMLDTGEAFGSPAEEVLPFDHIYRGFNSDRCIVVYADISSGDFETWHSAIMTDASVCYVLRFLPFKQEKQLAPLLLSGYGVQLQIKNQEYKVTDDREIHHEESFSSTLESNSYVDPEFDLYPPAIGKMEEADWMDVGVKTAIHILESNDKLKSLQHISQNFPRYQRFLFEKDVNDVEGYKRQVAENQASIPSSKALFTVNGLTVDVENFNLFSFVFV